MRIDKITPKEWIQLQKAQSISFIFPTDVEKLQKEAEETPNGLECDHSWGAFDENGKLISGMINWPFAMYYDGHAVDMGGIGGVITLPEGRAHGNIKNIFRRLFSDSLQRGELFSVLFPFSHRFYRQFGYEVCHEGKTYRFPMEALSRYKQTSTARMHHPEEPDSTFREIYQLFASRYNFAVARNDKAWRRMHEGDPYKCEAYRYILSRNGTDVSYCMFKPIKTGEFQFDMHVFDFAYVDKEALFDLLGFLYRLKPQFQNIRMEPPTDLAIGALIDEATNLSVLSVSYPMARVVNVEKALLLMRHPSEAGSYAIAVTDDFIPENSGVYEVHFKQTVTKVTKHPMNHSCELSITVQTFAQLCLGYLSLRMALLKPDVRLFGNRETMERVFIEKPRFFADRF